MTNTLILSKSNEILLLAYIKGYRVDRDGNLMNIKGRVLNPCNRNGYKRLGIRINSKEMRSFYVHRLAAYQKFGDKIFDSSIHVRHMNSNPSDNSWNNLEIGSAYENSMDRPKELRISMANKGADAIRKYDKEAVKKFYKEQGFKKTMDHFGITSKGTMSYIINH